MNICTNSFHDEMMISKERPTLLIRVQMSAATSMKQHSSTIWTPRESFLLHLPAYLTYMIFMQSRVIRANELDKTFEVAFIMSPGAYMSLDTIKMMPTRNENAAAIARAIHFRNLCAAAPEITLSLWRIFEKATMLQPRISVVSAVESACIANTELIT